MKSPDQAVFKAILITSMIIAIALLPAVAKADHHKMKGPPAFSEIDADGDGLVSEQELAEFRAARMTAAAEAGRPMKGAATAPSFEDLDTDGDGMLNDAELTAGQKAHRQAMHEQHGKGKGVHHGHGMGMPTFSDLDLDGDGCINTEEFARHQAERHGKPQKPAE